MPLAWFWGINMSVKTFFTILAVLAVVHGIGFVLAPEQTGSAYGLEASPSSLLTGRFFGGHYWLGE